MNAGKKSAVKPKKTSATAELTLAATVQSIATDDADQASVALPGEELADVFSEQLPEQALEHAPEHAPEQAPGQLETALAADTITPEPELAKQTVARNIRAAPAPLPASAEQAQIVIAQIQAQAQALSDAQRAHLQAHSALNPLRDLNARCFAELHSFRPMTILFSNLRANSKAFLSIRPDQAAIWSEGGANSRMVGLSFCAIVQPTMYLRNFLINAREMFLETYEDCTAIELSLYVRTEQHQLKGKVDLPPGASVTLSSRCDRTSLIGLSSFGIDLE
jgi:hypothetical protein